MPYTGNQVVSVNEVINLEEHIQANPTTLNQHNPQQQSKLVFTSTSISLSF